MLQPHPQQTSPARRPGVLIVDDAPVVRSVLGQAILQKGYVVWTAGEGGQALDIYRQHGPEIDLVLLDVRMPGLDGVQTLEALRALNPDVRCCFVTGGSSAEAEDLLAAGALEVLLKPIEPRYVVEAVERVLSRAGQAV